MGIVVCLQSTGRMSKTFFSVPTDIPYAIAIKGNSFARQRLPTESIGAINLSFPGIKAGSELWLMDQSRNVLAGTDSAGLNHSLSVNYFAPGSAKNNIRILIIALGYEVLDLSYTLPSVSTPIPIFQRIDRTYNNPA